jgi:Domain of Unknown Function (DUF1206)
VTPSAHTTAARHRPAQRAARHEWTRRLAGLGLAARSVLYGVIGVLVLQVAYGSDRRRTDSNGAFHALARQPLGRAMLVVLALGLVAYAIWRFVEAASPHPGREHDALIRVVDLGRGFVYGGLCALDVATIISARQTQKQGQERQVAASILDWPGGRFIVAAIGSAIIVGGLTNAWHLFDGSWRDNVDFDRLGSPVRGAVTGLAVVGLLGRVVVFVAVGAFAVQAAVDHDARKSGGLDEALHRLARAEHGSAILTVVAVGLLAYALYSIAEAVLRPSPED